jgi:hypothetical protein
MAREHGLGDVVAEFPARVSYRKSLEALRESAGLLILGVDDPGYMPSKLVGYALTGKPLLASVRRDGPAFEHFCKVPELGHALWFGPDSDMPLECATNAMNGFLEAVAARREQSEPDALADLLSPAMARRHAELFNACLEE